MMFGRASVCAAGVARRAAERDDADCGGRHDRRQPRLVGNASSTSGPPEKVAAKSTAARPAAPSASYTRRSSARVHRMSRLQPRRESPARQVSPRWIMTVALAAAAIAWFTIGRHSVGRRAEPAAGAEVTALRRGRFPADDRARRAGTRRRAARHGLDSRRRVFDGRRRTLRPAGRGRPACDSRFTTGPPCLGRRLLDGSDRSDQRPVRGVRRSDRLRHRRRTHAARRGFSGSAARPARGRLSRLLAS